MDRTDAIKWLQRIRTRQTGGRDEYDNARREAIDMACKMLGHKNLVTATYCENCEHYRADGTHCLIWNSKTIPVGWCFKAVEKC